MDENNNVQDTVNNVPATVTEQPVVEERKFSVSEIVFAWISLLAGYLFCRSFPAFKNPTGAFLFISLLLISSIGIFAICGKKMSLYNLLVAVAVFLVAITLLLNSNVFLFFWIFNVAILLYSYFIYSVNDNNIGKRCSNFIVADFFKALFVLPFHSIGKIFKALFQNRNSRKSNVVFKILMGLLGTIIPTGIIIALLSYDEGFSAIMQSIRQWLAAGILSRLMSLIFGIPVAMYIFGMFISSKDQKGKELYNAEQCEHFGKSVKIIPAITAASVMLPPVVIYIIFFVSQWKYYLSAFGGVLIEELTYAQYAREGFFQLCIVAAINLVIIILAVCFIKKEEKASRVTVKVMTVIYTLCTLILMATAMSKLFLYIESYGLTQKRVYAAWFMLVIAVVFVIIALSQFITKLSAAFTSVVACALLFLVLAIPNTDRIIVSYNVDRYLQGSISTFDLEAMSDIGYSAVPDLVRLKSELSERLSENKNNREDQKLHAALHTKLQSISREIESNQDNIYKTNLPKLAAEKALKDAGFLKNEG